MTANVRAVKAKAELMTFIMLGFHAGASAAGTLYYARRSHRHITGVIFNKTCDTCAFHSLWRQRLL